MNNNALQTMMDAMSAQWQLQRSETQMTLGDMIGLLSALNPETEIEGFHEPHSYRGYYTDLAFEKSDAKTTALTELTLCQDCLGKTFQGYKGGDFVMKKTTPLWIANYSECGLKIMSIKNDGSFELVEDE